MAIIKNKEVTVIDDETVNPTVVKYIVFGDDENERVGVNKTLNGYNFCLSEILKYIKHELNGELNGAKIITELEPNTQLCSKELDLNEDTIYNSTIGVENPVITITEKDIKRANHTVQQYEYLLSIINLLLAGSNEIDKPKYELLP